MLQQDVRRAAQTGFICITQAADGSPLLYAFDAGPSYSVTGGPNGTGTLSCTGQCTSTGSQGIIWHVALVLNGATGSASGDSYNQGYDSANLQCQTRAGQARRATPCRAWRWAHTWARRRPCP